MLARHAACIWKDQSIVGRAAKSFYFAVLPVQRGTIVQHVKPLLKVVFLNYLMVLNVTFLLPT